MPILKAAIDSRTLLRTLVSVLFICAIAGLVLTAVFGFEEPNASLLFLSSGLLFAAIFAVLVHLAVTGALTRPQKRVWLTRLTGRRAPWAWGEYLTCDDLRAAAMRFAAENATSNPVNRSRHNAGEAP
jgi:hypothetical protein